MKTFLLTRLHINPALVPLKIHYFVFFAGIACALPFRTVYAKQLGISGSATGVIFAVTCVTRLLSNPLFGVILDRFKKFRLTLVITMVILAAAHLAMIFIPPQSDSVISLQENYTCNARMWMTDLSTQDHTLSLGISCRQRCTFSIAVSLNTREEIPRSHQHCLNQTLVNFTIVTFKTEEGITSRVIEDGKLIFSRCSSNKTTVNDMCNEVHSSAQLHTCSCCGRITCEIQICDSTNDTVSDFDNFHDLVETMKQKGSSSFQFWTFLFLMVISSASISAVMFMVDAICYEILEKKPEKYGVQRLFGTMGWGLGALLGGYFNQFFTGDSDIIDYSPCFYLLTGICLLDILPIFWMEVKNVKFSNNIFKDTKKVFSKPSVICYIIMVFFIGIISGMLWNYQFWFLEDIGASQLLLGLSQIVECFIAEVPCFIVAGWVIKKIGHINCNSITLLFFGLRYFCFAYMYDPWWSLPAGLLHGPTFGLFFASMTAFAKEEAPPGTEATTQAVLSAVFEAMGAGAGSFIGGIGFDHLGGRATFFYTAVSCFLLLVINALLHYFVWRRR